MRARLFTAHGTLGVVDLVDGADVRDVVQAMRDHRLFIVPADDVPAAAAASPLAPETTTMAETDVPPRRRGRA